MLKNKLLFPFLFFIAFSGCEKDKLAQTCQVSEESKEWFLEDTYRLTLKHIFQDSSSIYHHYKDSIELPAELFEKIEAKLGVIYDKLCGPIGDTIINVYEIHDYPLFLEEQLIFRLEKTEEWVEQFLNKEPITKNDAMAELIEKYDIRLEGTLLNFPTSVYARVTVKPLLNLRALGKKIEAIDGVRANSSELNIIGGDGDLIEIIFTSDNSTTVNFGIARASFCPSGCSISRYWRFTIDENCIPKFTGN